MTLTPDTSLVHEVRQSPNFGERRNGIRVSVLLLHYTGVETAAKAIDWLTHVESKVSCHYVIDSAGHITQMVAEDMRAWHAGESMWAGERDINSASIGIEIHNPGHDWGYVDFPDVQMDAVEALCRDVIRRHRIRAERVLAHSDVAPRRKRDPGEKFPWDRLARVGVGHWVEPEAVDPAEPGLTYGVAGPLVADVQKLLAAYGYEVEATGLVDAQTAFVVTSFQRHFRPARVDGLIDQSTIATLESLIDALPRNPLVA